MPWNVSVPIYIHLIGRTIAANDLEHLFPEWIMVSTTFPYLADTAAATAVTLAYVVWDTHFHIVSRKGRWWSAIGVYTLLQAAFMVLLTVAQHHHSGRLSVHVADRLHCIWRAISIQGIGGYEVSNPTATTKRSHC